jgi:hypothetical protein
LVRRNTQGVGKPDGQQTGAQLRLQRLPEGVVLRQRQRGDEFAEAEWF